MKDNKLLFTQGFIERIATPQKRIKYYDTKVQGLLLEVMPTNAKIFRFRKKVDGKQQWATIGPFPVITLEEARDAAIKLSSQLIDGESFTETRKAIKEELILSELAELYFDQYAKDRCVTANKMRQNFNRWFEAERMLKLSEIDTACIQLRVNKLALGGHCCSANRALGLIRTIINWGIKKGLLKTNPAKAVDQFKEKSRERFIQPSEFAPLLDAINGYHDERMRDFFLLCLYTGARSGNVKSMRWDQIDFDLGTWQIPDTKNGESQTIQLSESALVILERRYKKRALIPWVLPGGGKSKRGMQNHMVEPKQAWHRILTNAGIEELRIHDLRRTLASFMVMTGASTPIVQKQLGHKSMAAAAVYQRVNNSPVKLAADQAIKVMQHYAEVQTVSELRKKGSDSVSK